MIRNYELIKLKDGSEFKIWKTKGFADIYEKKRAKKGFRILKYQSLGKNWVTID